MYTNTLEREREREREFLIMQWQLQMEVSFDEIGKSMKTPDMTQQHDDASKQTNFSGCGSVGRVGASDTKGPRFESSHRQKFIL